MKAEGIYGERNRRTNPLRREVFTETSTGKKRNFVKAAGIYGDWGWRKNKIPSGRKEQTECCGLKPVFSESVLNLCVKWCFFNICICVYFASDRMSASRATFLQATTSVFETTPTTSQLSLQRARLLHRVAACWSNSDTAGWHSSDAS